MSIAPYLLPTYTYSDYEIWDGDWELIDGHPFAMAPKPMREHQSLEFIFAKLLMDEFEECEECEVLGEIDWKINEKTVVAPDIVVICNEDGEKYITKVPKIIIEILSPSTEQKDRTIKYALYEEQGVGYYIIANPKDLSLEFYRLVDGKYVRDEAREHKYRFAFDECEKEVDFVRALERAGRRRKNANSNT